jgi:arginine metabolism regulation protein II
MGLRRKPLFSGSLLSKLPLDPNSNQSLDRERIAECCRMTRKVSDHQVEALLLQLDSQAETLDHDTPLQNGPFGVFSLQQQHVSSPLSPPVPDPEALPVVHELPEENWYGLDFMNDQPLQDFQSISIKAPLPLSWGTSSPMLAFGEGMDEAFNMDLNQTHDMSGMTDLATFFALSPRLPTPVSLSFSRDVADLAPGVMRTLLDHYQTNMMSCFTPLHHEKPPWKVLHLPCAISAYGELSLLGDCNNAKMTLLFAVLAMSAFNLKHLQTIPTEADNWQSIAECYRERAKSRLKICLGEQSEQQKKSKYKEVLMALTSMVTVCVVSGQMQEARCYLLDAERVIYMQSLRKEKRSRKVNMLHSIYLYLRIIEESTFVPGADSEAHNGEIANETHSDICRYPSLWSDGLKLNSNLDSQDMVDLETRLVKFPTDRDEPSMFEQIYGVPESLFRLISHATHLAEAVRRSRFAHPGGGMSHHVVQRAKIVENNILQWKNPYRLLAQRQTLIVYGPAESSDKIEVRTELLFDFLEAMHSALLIYFYRRVRDLNAIALQHFVAKTIHHLLEHERKKIKYGDTSAYVAWPGFIAACEALDPVHREQMCAFMFRAGRQSGMAMFDTASDVATKVWAARDDSGCLDVSWSDILATSRNGLIVT